MNEKIKKEWKNLIFDGIFAILTVAIVIIFYRNIFLTTILVGIISIIGLIKWKSKMALIMFLFGALFGAFAQMISINYGVWSHAYPSFMNVPIWLFLVWGNAAVFLYQTALESKKLGVKK